ncbi:MAG TPA: DUF192 domain-containing protein [Bacteroidetes bacterium]|nr:DUF192 domain-containing protein [Bacteroidota bacterium]
MPRGNNRQLIMTILIGLAIIAFVLPDIMPLFSGGGNRRVVPSGIADGRPTNPSTPMPEPTFTKERELSIISSKTGKVIRRIDIEKAENDQERTIGMMFRKSMPDTRGMLFLFDRPAPQSFWMKNTLIPLDIIFIDENKKITTIHPYATPRSESPLPSNGDAQYVLEVRGGFCNDYGINIGDIVEWQ